MDIITQTNIIRQDINELASQYVEIVPATKTRDASTINSLISADIYIAGENRVQELLSKYNEVDTRIKWHFIGRLQTNKVKYIIDKVDLIHSVDRIELVKEIDRQASKIGKVQDILVQINSGMEESKGGISFDEAYDFVNLIASDYPNVRVCGLMGVMPIEDEEVLAGYYSKLYDTYACIKNANIQNTNIKWLPAGMSDDYKIALKYGANMIRPGRILFGDR